MLPCVDSQGTVTHWVDSTRLATNARHPLSVTDKLSEVARLQCAAERRSTTRDTGPSVEFRWRLFSERSHDFHVLPKTRSTRLQPSVASNRGAPSRARLLTLKMLQTDKDLKPNNGLSPAGDADDLDAIQEYHRDSSGIRGGVRVRRVCMGTCAPCSVYVSTSP